MKKRIAMTAAALAALLLLAGCFPPGSETEPAGDQATLVLQLAPTGVLVARTIQPDINMQIAYYRVTGTRSDGLSFEQQTEDTLVASIKPGLWTFVVEAYNSATPAEKIGEGQATIEVAAGEVASESIPVLPLDENPGVLDIIVSWPADILTAPQVTGTYAPVGGTSTPLSFNPLTNAVQTTPLLDPGYYVLTFALTEGPAGDRQKVWGTVDTARIVAGATSAHQYELVEDVNRGGITIDPVISDPIPVSILGVDGPLVEGEQLNVSADTSGELYDSLQWYLNGDPIPGATEATLTVGAALEPGYYWLDVVVTRGSVVGSANARLEVVAATAPALTTAGSGVPGPMGDTLAIDGEITLSFNEALPFGETNPSVYTHLSGRDYYLFLAVEEEVGPDVTVDTDTNDDASVTLSAGAPTPAQLFPPDDYYDGIGTLVSSNPGAKIVETGIGTSDDAGEVGFFWFDEAGQRIYYEFYVYASEPTVLSGSTVDSAVNNVSLETGWNLVIEEYDLATDTVTMGTTVPAELGPGTWVRGEG